MKIETILNAFAWSERLIVLEKHPRRSRQYRAFRARILRMDEEKNETIRSLIAELEKANEEVSKYRYAFRMYYSLYTSTIAIPWTFVADYLDDCGPIYPDLKPQHGMPDTLRRDYVQAFTREVVANGLAEKPVGNQPAKWLLPYSEVLDVFGLGNG